MGMRPTRGSTPRRSDWVTIRCKVTWTTHFTLKMEAERSSETVI